MPREECPHLARSSSGLKDKDVGCLPLSQAQTQHIPQEVNGLRLPSAREKVSLSGFFPCRFDPTAATVD